jgi:hypothetical protein
VKGIYWALILQGSILLLGGLRPSVPLIICAAAVFMFAAPFVTGLSQAIWQSKVAVDAQGRVLAMEQMVALAFVPLAYALSGPLADRVFEPLLAPGGPLAGTLGHLIGIGPGRGVGLLFITLGLSIILFVLLSFLDPRLRHVEIGSG